MQNELKLTGSGGQGLITAGSILAQAALIDGKHTIQSQSYGPEARGGASKAEVIISDSAIDFVKVQKCDMLLCLTQAAYDRYGKDYTKLLILDSRLTLKYPEPEKVVKIPILDSAADKLNKPMVANIIALGAINGILKLVAKDSLAEAVMNNVPKGTQEINKRALELGYDLIG